MKKHIFEKFSKKIVFLMFSNKKSDCEFFFWKIKKMQKKHFFVKKSFFSNFFFVDIHKDNQYNNKEIMIIIFN